MPIRVQRQIERHPMAMVWSLLILMATCVLGLIGWKAEAGREAAIGRAEQDIKNLVHSLTQHAVHTIRAPDAVMAAVAEMLAYRKPDSAERLNSYLASTVRSLPQLREIRVLDRAGDGLYSSALLLGGHNNADREYFQYHQSQADPELLISGPFYSRTTGLPTIVLSRRITDARTGEFVGVVMASILTDYFGDFYRTFGIGEHGGVSLITGQGKTLVHLPSGTSGKDLSQTELFKVKLGQQRTGFYPITSPFDGLSKYFGYEQADEYGLVVTVARTYEEIVSSWRDDLKIDAIVAVGLLLAILTISIVLARQFKYRSRLEQSLRERERRHRLLADNIADVVVVLDSRGICQYVSQSVSSALGMSEEQVLGRPYIDFVHSDDRPVLARVGQGRRDGDSSASVSFRMMHTDGSTVWLEANFRAMDVKGRHAETVAVLRDITQRKALEEQLSSANRRLSQLATTDGLTRLANRRSFDAYLREAIQRHSSLAVLLIDIDHFKGFNDALGHQAGDECLRRIAGAIANAAAQVAGHAARYGGEEFAIVIPGATENDALALANALREMVRTLAILHPSGGYLSASIGVAVKPDNACDEAALVREADVALYHAKSLGRDQAVAASTLQAIPAYLGSSPSIAPKDGDIVDAAPVTTEG